MKTIILLASVLVLPAVLAAQGDVPVVHVLDQGLQQKVQFLNPEYLVYAPSRSSDAKLPLLIFLHGAGGVGQDIHRIAGRPSEIWAGIGKFGKGPCLVVAPQCLKTAKGERGIWQRRYWEHTLRDERDWERHVDYIHYNPVRHGHAKRVSDWPYSSFHRFVRLGILPVDWGSGEPADGEWDFGERG